MNGYVVIEGAVQWDENAALFFLGGTMEQKSKCACANSICHLCAQLPGLPNNVIQTKFQSKCRFVSLLIFDQFPRLSPQCIMNFFGRKYFIAIIIILLAVAGLTAAWKIIRCPYYCGRTWQCAWRCKRQQAGHFQVGRHNRTFAPINAPDTRPANTAPPATAQYYYYYCDKVYPAEKILYDTHLG